MSEVLKTVMAVQIFCCFFFAIVTSYKCVLCNFIFNLGCHNEKSSRLIELFSNCLKQLCFSENETFIKHLKTRWWDWGKHFFFFFFFKLKGFI